MSSVEWVHGEVVLPRSDVAQFRRAVRRIQDGTVDKAYDFLKKFRHANPTNSSLRWDMAIESCRTLPAYATPHHQLAFDVAELMGGPRAVKWDDFDTNGSYLNRPKVGTNVFLIRDKKGSPIGELVFYSRRLVWVVPPVENAHDRLDSSPMYKLIMSQLNSTMWHRGTGGGETRCTVSGQAVVTERHGSKGRSYRAFQHSPVLVGPE